MTTALQALHEALVDAVNAADEAADDLTGAPAGASLRLLTEALDAALRQVQTLTRDEEPSRD